MTYCVLATGLSEPCNVAMEPSRLPAMHVRVPSGLPWVGGSLDVFFIVSVRYVPQLCIHMLLVAGGSVAPAALLACLGPPLLPLLSAHLHQWPACRWLVRDGPSVLLCRLGGGSFTCVLHSAGWRPCCVVYCPSRVHVVCCWHRRLGLLPDADVCSVIDAFCTAVTAQWDDLTPFAKAWVVPHWQCITAQH
jgi:hypothetical protein